MAALIGLAGALGATLALHRAGATALDRVLEERLRGAGETAAQLLGGATPDPAALRAPMDANGLEGACLLAPDLRILADAAGRAGARADLLRVDGARVAAAFSGTATVAFAYAVGDVPVATGYFPVRAEGGAGGGPRADGGDGGPRDPQPHRHDPRRGGARARPGGRGHRRGSWA